jgi:uncharacterized DUF497 family protein
MWIEILFFVFIEATIKLVEIEFDPAKDAENTRKHGVSLGLVRELVWEEAYAWPDDRFDYDECRMSALVPAGERLYYVAYVDRGDIRRVISLRPVTNREKMTYVAEYR